MSAAASYVWDGGTDPARDAPVVDAAGPVIIGRFGGSAAHGARKNEDAALAWAGAGWVFAAILDAHGGISSATAMLALLGAHRPAIEGLLQGEDPTALVRLRALLVEMITGAAATAPMAGVRGETACLIACAKGSDLLWLSIGDNMLYVSHPELAALGQHSLTVRNFYEWIGEQSSVRGPVPAFSTGIRALRQGRSIIALMTDGLLEMGDRRYEQAAAVHRALVSRPQLRDAVATLLAEAVREGAADSCTILAWTIDNPRPALMPSA